MLASGTIITPDLKPDWLAERSRLIGASEVAAAIGASPWQTPVELWQRKTGRAGEVVQNKAMFWGSKLEPGVIEGFEELYGLKITRRQEFIRHPIYPFLAATLDGVAGDELIEVKTTSAYSKGFGKVDADEFPEQYRIQVHAQMACSGHSKGRLLVLIGGQEDRVYPFVRHDPLVNLIEDRCAEFWACVENDTPPTWGKPSASDLAIINPECHGDAEWGPVTSALIAQTIEQIEAEKEAIASGEERIKGWNSDVLATLGKSAFGFLPDGRKVKRYLEHHEERAVSYTSKPYDKHYFKVLKGKP